MSAAVDHLISQALISLLHYIIEEEDEEEKGEKDSKEGDAEKNGGTAHKTLSTQ